MLIQKHMIESDDLFFNPGWFGAEEDIIFNLKKDTQPILTQNPNAIALLGFSLHKSVVSHSRAIYNVLDFLGDIGGLRDALKLIAQILVSFFTSGGMMNHLISRVFYNSKLEENQSQSSPLQGSDKQKYT